MLRENCDVYRRYYAGGSVFPTESFRATPDLPVNARLPSPEIEVLYADPNKITISCDGSEQAQLILTPRQSKQRGYGPGMP
jgi:hypothetical protein